MMHQNNNTQRSPQWESDSGICTVQNRIAGLLGSNFSGLESASLRLNKMLNYSKCGKGRVELDEICKCANKHKALPAPMNVPGMMMFQMKLAARLIVDQSGSVLNMGILLHRNFSCPYIPGSALKGVANHYVLDQLGEDHEDYKRIFGMQEHAGTVSFLNAFPANTEWKMVVDVLTRHNDPDDEKMDYKNPVPIFFPAMEKGCLFEFRISPVGSNTNQDDVKLAAKYLKEALTLNGVGAKTSAGYGWFEEVKA